jgi:hypothetical protein
VNISDSQLRNIARVAMEQKVGNRQVVHNNTRETDWEEILLLVGRAAFLAAIEVALSPTPDNFSVTTSDTDGLSNSTNTDWDKLMEFVNKFLANRLKALKNEVTPKDPTVVAVTEVCEQFRVFGEGHPRNQEFAEKIIAAVRATKAA